MQFIRYGHSHQGESGYKILESFPELFAETNDKLLRLVQDLRFTAAEIENSSGWFWRKFSHSQFVRAFGIATAKSNLETKLNTIEIRLVLLTETECDQLAWQPFPLASWLLDSSRWNPIDEGRFEIPESVHATGTHTPESIQEAPLLLWLEFANIASDLLPRLVNQHSIETRREVEFTAPKCGKVPLRIDFGFSNGNSSANKSKKHSKFKSLFGVVVIALVVGSLGVGLPLWNSLKENNRQHGESIESFRKENTFLKNKLESLCGEDNIGVAELKNTSKFIQDLLHRIHEGDELIAPEKLKNLTRSIRQAADYPRLNKALEIWLGEENAISTSLEHKIERSKHIAKLSAETKTLENLIKRIKREIDGNQSEKFEKLRGELNNCLAKIEECLSD